MGQGENVTPFVTFSIDTHIVFPYTDFTKNNSNLTSHESQIVDNSRLHIRYLAKAENANLIRPVKMGFWIGS